MNDESVGDVMTEGRDQAIKSVAIGAGVVVYLGMLLYSAVHNWRLMTAGVSAELVLWAALGVIALEISAAALPLALHWWCHAPLQRLAAFAFYGLDLGLIMFNVIVDYAGGVGEGIPYWLQLYNFFIVPVAPIVAGLGWSVLFLLDPSQRERAVTETLRAAVRDVLTKRIAQQARQADVTAQVEQAAQVMAGDIVRQTLGVAMRRTAPAGVIDAQAKDAPTMATRRRNPGITWRKPTRTPINYNATTTPTPEGSPDFLSGNGSKPE